MDIKFDGDEKLISKVMKKSYNIEVQDCVKIKDGIINTSFILTSDKFQKYVFRVFRRKNKTKEEIDTELNFMKLLRENGIPIPEIFRNVNNLLITCFRDPERRLWNSILMEFAEGDHLVETQTNLIPDFAKYQALMHLVAESKFKMKMPIDKSFRLAINWMMDEYNTAKKLVGDKDIMKNFDRIISEINADIKNNIKEIYNLPSGATHLDYDSNNVIISENRIKSIIDFDDMQRQPFVLDTSNSLWWWLYNNPFGKINELTKTYFHEYLTHRKLSQQEAKFIPLFIRMRNATLGALLFINLEKKADKDSLDRIFEFDQILKNYNKTLEKVLA